MLTDDGGTALLNKDRKFSKLASRKWWKGGMQLKKQGLLDE